MLNFLFFNITFENLFILTSIIAIFVVLTNLIYWPVFFFIRKRKGAASPKIKAKNSKSRLDSALKTPKPSKTDWFKNPKNYLSLNFIIPVFSLIGIGLAGYGVYQMFYGYPEIITRFPENDTYWEDPRKPLVLEFNKPIDTKRIQPKFVPEINGEFKYEKSFSFLPFSRKMIFQPSTNFEPEVEESFYVAGIYALGEKRPRYDHEASFKTTKVAEIKSISITDDHRDFPIEGTIELEIENSSTMYYDFEFEISPKADFKTENLGDDKVKLEFVSTLPQSTEYNLKVYRVDKTVDLMNNEVTSKSERVPVKEVNFRTVDSPQVKTFIPIGTTVPVTSEIKIEFSQQMDQESVAANLEIVPDFPKTLQWPNGNTLVIKQNKNLEYGTAYSIKVKAGAKGKGTIFEKDFNYKFTTIGEARVVSFSPSNGTKGIAITNSIRINFDQEVDRASAQSKFAIAPTIDGAFSWDKNSMIFKPNAPMAYNTRYSVTINPGVKSKIGKDSSVKFSSSFTTNVQTVVLAVPLTKQPNRFDCNLTAAQMVLRYRGVNISVDGVYSQIAKDSTTYDAAANTWGNPSTGYVGDRNGPNGYGVHWNPVSSVISKYRQNKVVRNASVNDIAREIAAGNPSIVWWQNNVSTPSWKTWNLPGGGTFTGLNGMHSEVVIGFIGSVDNPTAFIVNDPRGSKKTMPVGEFKRLWAYFNNTAIIVY